MTPSSPTSERPKSTAANDSGNKSVADQISLLRSDLTGIAEKVTGLNKGQIEHTVSDWEHRAQESRSDFEKAVRRQPAKSAAYAVGAGFLLGLLLTR